MRAALTSRSSTTPQDMHTNVRSDRASWLSPRHSPSRSCCWRTSGSCNRVVDASRRTRRWRRGRGGEPWCSCGARYGAARRSGGAGWAPGGPSESTASVVMPRSTSTVASGRRGMRSARWISTVNEQYQRRRHGARSRTGCARSLPGCGGRVCGWTRGSWSVPGVAARHGGGLGRREWCLW